MELFEQMFDEKNLCNELQESSEKNAENKDGGISMTKTVLKRLSQNWENRAKVRNHKLSGEDLFDLEKKDFLTDLLPFKDHPKFIEASEKEKDRILTCGWLAYNEKTIELENFVLTPTCLDIYNNVFPGVDNDVCKEVVSETLIDESYHTFLTSHSSQITKRHRKMENFRVPKSSLVFNIQRLQSRYPERWQKSTILLATAIVTEIFVGGYLSAIANAKDIQPLNIITARAHLRDELAHSCIFRGLTNLIYSAMSKVEKEFFSYVLPYPVCWLVENDLDLWNKLLYQINFKERDKLIKECKLELTSPLEKADFSDLVKLSTELGINDIDIRISECVDNLSRSNL